MLDPTSERLYKSERLADLLQPTHVFLSTTKDPGPPGRLQGNTSPGLFYFKLNKDSHAQ